MDPRIPAAALLLLPVTHGPVDDGPGTPGPASHEIRTATTGDPEEEAAALLEKAEADVARGSHTRAVRAYEKIVERYPRTAAAEVARRRSRPNAFLGASDVVRHGESSNRVDIVFLGDGYELGDIGEFDDIVGDVPRVFERNPTFREYYAYLNLVRADVRSEESGIDAYGKERSTALGGAMGEGPQGQVTVDRRAVHAMMDQELDTHDGIAVVLVRAGTSGTGGGGVAAVAAREFGTLIHELGHAFASLQDEYSTHTGFRGETRNRINVSNSSDPATVPWAHWIEAGVRGVGVYEGADGQVRGAWKPTSKGCVMGNGQFFCVVCREALVLRIHAFVDPIDAAVPADGASLVLGPDDEPQTFSVQVMQPESHHLEVSWWLLPEAEAPPAVPHDPELASQGRRADRGPLPPIEAKPDQHRRQAKRGTHEFVVKPRGLEPGRYRLICRAVDTTELRGERHPWVLKDPAHLLRSERRWTVLVE